MTQPKFSLGPDKGSLDLGEEVKADTFAGNPIFTFHTIVFFVFAGWMIVIANSSGKLTPRQDATLLVSSILGMYLLIGIQMFYFKISGLTLIVKNHYLPWIKWHYDINKISKFAILHYYKLGNGVNFKVEGRPFYRVFVAGSLRKKHWLALRQRLEGMGVPVQDRIGQ